MVVINASTTTHKDVILKLMRSADDIIFAAGFLRKSGIDNIKDQLQEICANGKRKVSFYIGTGLGESDPDALKALYNLIKLKPKHKLVLCTPKAGIFHPKIYIFRNGSNVTMLLGSANLTDTGWSVNDEVSILIETTTTNADFIQLDEYFNGLDEKYLSENVAQQIESYSDQLASYETKNPRRLGFQFKDISKVNFDFDMSLLTEYYGIYKRSKHFVKPIDRQDQYQEAKINIDHLISPVQLTKKEFHDKFGPLVGHVPYAKLWHSGSIHRKTHVTVNSKKHREVFRELLRVASANVNSPVAITFNLTLAFLKDQKKQYNISGIGVNILAEILMTLEPSRFANLNKNPLAVLRLVGKDFSSPSAFDGTSYTKYIEVLTTIKHELGMGSFLEIDSFFNYVYWTHIEQYWV